MKEANNIIKIIVGGDFCPQQRIKEKIEIQDYDFFAPIIPLIRSADFAILNLECPVIDNNLFSPLPKIGPSLYAPANSLKILERSGFNVVTLANNHMMDYGEKGLKETMHHLLESGIKYVGAGKDAEEASQVLILNKKDFRVAIINCCENEFSISTMLSAGTNALNPIRQYNIIKKIKDEVNKIIVIVHGGHEGFQLPSLRMQETYRFFIDAGADIVINHHQHCYSGWERYNEKPIFYGLGNLCFDKNNGQITPWNYGYLLELNLSEKGDEFSLHPYIQCGSDPTLVPLSIDEIEYKLKELNTTISSQKLLREAQNKYYDQNENSIRNKFEPFQNRYVNKLRKIFKFPFLMRRKNLRILRNYIECESHRDKLIHFLQKNT